MKLPSTTSSARTHYTFGLYVRRRLWIARHHDLVDEVEAANAAIVAAARAVEDLEAPRQNAIASRDFVDETLDDMARQVRLTLSARSVDAAQEHPYLGIFPGGINEYVKAKHADQAIRYTTLADRIERFLPADDPVRLEVPPQLREQIASWKQAIDAIEAARSQIRIARGVRDDALTAWREVLSGVYGQLIARTSKSQAERFFPRGRSSRSASEPSDVPDAPAEAGDAADATEAAAVPPAAESEAA